MAASLALEFLPPSAEKSQSKRKSPADRRTQPKKSRLAGLGFLIRWKILCFLHKIHCIGVPVK
jgi:hypothetical protein